MKIEKLINILQKVQKKEGNIEVKFNSYCGTNDAHVQFDSRKMKKSFRVNDYLNGHGEFCFQIALTDETREKEISGIKDMETRGYTFYMSQFVEKGKTPKKGLSPCEWHGIW